MNKILSILTLMCIILPFNVHAQKINWLTFEEAIELNKANPKKIFIDVYTDWCGWCTKMDQTTFTDSEVVEYMNENFYPVKLNAEQQEPIEYNGYTFKFIPQGRRGAHQLAASLLQGKMSYPSYVFMNEEEKLITILPGYMKAPEFITILEFIGSDSFLSMPFEEFKNKNTDTIKQ